MGWRHDEKQARKRAESDPAGALALLERVVPEARESSLCSQEHVAGLMELEADVAERAGRHEVAVSVRDELNGLLEQQLAAAEARVAEAKGAMTMAGALAEKARVLGHLGRQLDADRAHIQAADVLMASIGDTGAKARMASTPFYVATQGAMGLEFARAFQHGFDSNTKAMAEGHRDPLLEAGRAVALTYCKKCGGVVEANPKKNRCVAKHKVDEIRVCVTADADEVRADLSR